MVSRLLLVVMTATQFDGPPEESMRAGWLMPSPHIQWSWRLTNYPPPGCWWVARIKIGSEGSVSETYLTEDSLASQ